MAKIVFVALKKMLIEKKNVDRGEERNEFVPLVKIEPHPQRKNNLQK